MQPAQIPRNRLSIALYNKPIQKRERIDFTINQDLHDVIEVMNRPKNFKYPAHIEIVKMGFSCLPLFQDLELKMGKQTVEPIYKELQYEFFENRQTVFSIGDMGRKFYIIMRGSVNVMVPKSGQLNQNEQNQLSRRDHSKLSEQEFLDQYFPNLLKIKVMEQGESFGEIALSQLVSRTATIICREDCHFATLSRESFNNLLAEYYKILQEQIVNFLKRVSLFSELDEVMINQISYYFELKEFSMNHIIYKEKDPASQIFIIKEGEVEISHDFEFKTRELSQEEIILQHYSKQPKNNIKQKRLRQAVLSQGSIFGEEEVLNNTVRESMAKCVSQSVKLFVIEKYRFINFFQKGQLLDKFRKQIKQINNWRVQSESLNIKQFESNINLDRNHRASLAQQSDQKLQGRLHKNQYSIETSIQIRLGDTQDTKRTLQKQTSKSFATTNKQYPTLDRVAHNPQQSQFDQIQKKMHISTAIGNFKNNLEFINNMFKQKDNFSIDSAFFPSNYSKGMLDKILSKHYPGVSNKQDKEFIKKHKSSPNYLTKVLQLPKILDDSKMPSQNSISLHNKQSIQTSKN